MLALFLLGHGDMQTIVTGFELRIKRSLSSTGYVLPMFGGVQTRGRCCR